MDNKPFSASWSDNISALSEQAAAGTISSLVADFRILDVFSIYYDSKVLGHKDMFKYISVYLNKAQVLDPKFYEVYQLAASILAYDAKMPQEAVDILKKGSMNRDDVWQFPFFAGFIAHDTLNNDELAFELMSQVADKKGTPLLVITLASRFLASSSSDENAIMFLKGLLQMVPLEYQGGIKKRIRELEEGSVVTKPEQN